MFTKLIRISILYQKMCNFVEKYLKNMYVLSIIKNVYGILAKIKQERYDTMKKEQLVKALPTMEKVYFLASPLTKLPYVECNEETGDDQVFVYTEEEKIKEKLEQMKEKNIPANAVLVDKKSMLGVFSGLYQCGVNAIMFTSGEDVFSTQIEEVVRRPKIDELPEDKRPLENPLLNLSMMYFIQEARKKPEFRANEMMKEYEEEMVVNMARAKYLIPLAEDCRLDRKNEGEQQVKLLIIQAPDGKHYIPALTDPAEFRKFKGNKELDAVGMTFQQMLDLEKSDEISGFIINPASIAVPMVNEFLEQMKNKYTWA